MFIDTSSSANDPTLSVCMVAWNGCGLTLACLRSLRKHTLGTSYEVILVDNGSTDGTSDAVRAEFPDVRLITNTVNKGFPFANNQALRVAKGQYSILLNNDMIFESDALSQMVEFMGAHPDVGVLGCRLRYPDKRIQHTAHGDIRWQDHLFHALFLNKMFPRSRLFGHIDSTYLDFEDNRLVVEVGYVAGAALMVRRDYMEKVGLLDERILFTGEDWEWCRRFADKGYRVAYYTGAEIIHYHGMSTIRYEGPERERIRERSVLYQTATCHYVFRKLHAGEPVRIFLFSIAFRLHWLTRAIAHGLLCLLRSGNANRGVVRGFLRGAFMNYQQLSEGYLSSDHI